MKLEFTQGLFDEDNPLLADTLKMVSGVSSPRLLLVADHNVVQHSDGLGTRIGAYLQRYGLVLAATPVVMAGNEKLKADDLQSFRRLIHDALCAKLGKNDIMLVLGGGSLFDLAGIAASGCRGGMKLVKLPTTVAAMLEAAYVDEAALDTAEVKDAFRVPAPAEAVIVDSTFATTVLDGVWRAGFAEAFRFAAAKDARLFKKLTKVIPELLARDPVVLADIVKTVAKARVKSGGTTLGLWSALRLEAMSGYKLPHGYAVAIGTAIDFRYAAAKGMIMETEAEQVIVSLSELGALDALGHSRHLLAQPQMVLLGLDAWLLANPDGIELPIALGKHALVSASELDREVLGAAVASFAEV